MLSTINGVPITAHAKPNSERCSGLHRNDEEHVVFTGSGPPCSLGIQHKHFITARVRSSISVAFGRLSVTGAQEF